MAYNMTSILGSMPSRKSDYTNDKYGYDKNSDGGLNIYNPIYDQNLELKQHVRDINRLKYLGFIYATVFSLMINYF